MREAEQCTRSCGIEGKMAAIAHVSIDSGDAGNGTDDNEQSTNDIVSSGTATATTTILTLKGTEDDEREDGG